MWHDHETDFGRWLHPAMWHVALESWKWQHPAMWHCITLQNITYWWKPRIRRVWVSTAGLTRLTRVSFQVWRTQHSWQSSSEKSLDVVFHFLTSIYIVCLLYLYFVSAVLWRIKKWKVINKIKSLSHHYLSYFRELKRLKMSDYF